MRGAWLWQREPLKLFHACLMFVPKFLWHLHFFIAARFFASLCIQGASNLNAVVSGLNICLSSCSMMSDSCSDVFACSFFLNFT